MFLLIVLYFIFQTLAEGLKLYIVNIYNYVKVSDRLLLS